MCHLELSHQELTVALWFLLEVQVNISKSILRAILKRIGVWILEFSTCMDLAQCSQNQDTRQRR